MTITHEALARIAAVALLLAVQWRAAGDPPSPAPASDTLSVNVDAGTKREKDVRFTGCQSYAEPMISPEIAPSID